MLCPLDNQPCTMDHSQSCYDACDSQRRRPQPQPWSGRTLAQVIEDQEADA